MCSYNGRKIVDAKNHYKTRNKCQQIIPHVQRFIFLKTVFMLLAISYPLTIPIDFTRSSACEVIVDLVFLKANFFCFIIPQVICFRKRMVGLVACSVMGFKHTSESPTLRSSPFFKLLKYFWIFCHMMIRYSLTIRFYSVL